MVAISLPCRGRTAESHLRPDGDGIGFRRQGKAEIHSDIMRNAPGLSGPAGPAINSTVASMPLPQASRQSDFSQNFLFIYQETWPAALLKRYHYSTEEGIMPDEKLPVHALSRHHFCLSRRQKNTVLS